jgi:quinol monooxygenase YgiN
MLIHLLHFTFAPEDVDKAEAIMRELREISLREKGVVSFETARVEGNPNVFVLWEAYADTAAWDAHAASDDFKRLVLNGLRALAQQRVAETLFPL